MDIRSLNQKVALITGASSGIGLARAHALAKEGANVIICARRKERIEELTQSLIERHDTDAYGFALDVTDRQQVQEKLSTLPEPYKEIDILVILAANENARLHYSVEKVTLVPGKGLIGPYSLCGEYVIVPPGETVHKAKCKHFDL